MSLALKNHHPRDDRIQFQAESHIYTVDGVRDGWISCTKFLHSFFETFDSDAVIAKMMKSSKPNPKYAGMTPTEIKALWDAKGKAASEAGTQMHLDIENYYNSIPPATPANESKEHMFFLDYQKRYIEPLGYIPFRTEWVVFDECHKVSGSIDMVYKKPDGTLAIYDWKRAEDIKLENRFQSGRGPVSHLPDTNYWQYTIQLNVYRYILQSHYNVTVSELALVILHPSNSSWKVMKLNMLDDVIEEMMKTRKGEGIETA